MELVITLSEDTLSLYDPKSLHPVQRFHGSLIGGIRTEAVVIDTAPQTTIIGVHFKPGGAYPFLGSPASELHNICVSLDTLWGSSGANLRAQLLEAETPEAKFHLLEQTLLQQATAPLERRPAIAFALETFQTVPSLQTIADTTHRIGLSQRRFIQIFKEQVGLTPKLYCRIQRFQTVLRLVRQEASVDWVDIALACGYFDQAHFIRDFRAFSNFTPSGYLAQRSAQLNHVPLHD